METRKLLEQIRQCERNIKRSANQVRILCDETIARLDGKTIIKDYVLEGHCCICGQCCSYLSLPLKMMQNKNIEDGILYCDFIEFRGDKKHCRFVEALQTKFGISISEPVPIELLTPEILEEVGITYEQAVFCAGAIGFPNTRVNAYSNGKAEISDQFPKCTYKVKEIDREL